MVDSIPFLRVPAHLAPEKHRDFAILTMVGLLGFSAHVVFLICFLTFGVYSMAYFNVASCFIFAVVFMANRQTDSHLPGGADRRSRGRQDRRLRAFDHCELR